MIGEGGGDGLWPVDPAAVRGASPRPGRRHRSQAAGGLKADGGPASALSSRVVHPLPATGVALAQALAAAVPERLEGYDLVEVIAATGRLASWVDALQISALAELGRRRPDLDVMRRRDPEDSTSIATVSEFAPDEVAVALHVSRVSAENRLHNAITIAGRLPDTLTALHAGELPSMNARILADETQVLADAGPTGQQAATRVEHMVLPAAGKDTPGQFRARVRRAVLAAHPKMAEACERAARKGRRVQLDPTLDGMAWLSAFLPAPEAVAAYQRLTHLACQQPGDDPRGMDARRADILVDLLLEQPHLGDDSAPVEDEASDTSTGADSADGPDSASARPGQRVRRPGGRDGTAAGDGRKRTNRGARSGRRVAVHVTVPLDTLTGKADLPGELAGYGPITPATARGLAGMPEPSPSDEDSIPTGRVVQLRPDPAPPDTSSPTEGSTGRTGRDPDRAPPDTDDVCDAHPDDSSDDDPDEVLLGHTAWDPLWRRLVVDPLSGTLLDVGRRTYRPPVALDEHVALRDLRCRFPGCRRAAYLCDRDHVVPWPTGSTSAQNLASLCRRHHRLKHQAGWLLTVTDHTGGLEWTTPTGQSHTTQPEPVAPRRDVDDEPPF